MWLRGLRTWYCHRCGSSWWGSVGSILGPGNSTGQGCGQKEKEMAPPPHKFNIHTHTETHTQAIFFDENTHQEFLKFQKYQDSSLDTSNLFIKAPTEHNCSKLKAPNITE